MSKSYIAKFLRVLVEQRAKGYCEYCLMPAAFSPTSFTIDHIIPESLNGLTVAENLAFACGSCNRNKYDKIVFTDFKTNQIVRLYNPRQDNWNVHFRWNDDETIVIGLTAIGRATIDLLKINRQNNQNQRGLLRLIGLHPPSNF